MHSISKYGTREAGDSTGYTLIAVLAVEENAQIEISDNRSVVGIMNKERHDPV